MTIQRLSGRQGHLDAIRGLAALVVAIFHFLRGFSPGFIGDPKWSYISVFWNGSFAVTVFFVLSGYLFFGKFYCGSPTRGLAAGLKRYFRLSLPILGASIVAWLMHVAGFFSDVSTAAALTNSDWLERWYQFEPNIGLAIGEPLAFMYVGFDPMMSYNTNLWTISYELFAVWLAIAMGIVCTYLPKWFQLAMILVVGTITLNTFVFAFVVGAALFWVRHILLPGDRSTWASAILITFGLLAGSFVSTFPVNADLLRFLVWPLAAAALIGAVDMNKEMRRVFSWKTLEVLGRLSFGIYIVHFLTINSVAPAVYIATMSIWATFIAYACATAVGAVLFEWLLDNPTMRLIANVERWWQSGEKKALGSSS